MLKEIIKGNLLKAHAVIGFWKANAEADDIVLYNDDNTTKAGTLYGLRQQEEKDSDEKYLCMSDFVAPRDSGLTDHVGMFVTSCGEGCDALCKKVCLPPFLLSLPHIPYPFIS